MDSWAHAYNPALWEAEVGGSLESWSSRLAWATGETLSPSINIIIIIYFAGQIVQDLAIRTPSFIMVPVLTYA